MPGVMLQAHMTSQILSAALDRRSLLWVWPPIVEALWIWGWALAGGLLAWRFHHLLQLGIAIGVAIVGLMVICFVVMTKAGWIPLIPAGLALVGTSGLLVYLAFRRPTAIGRSTKTQEPIANSTTRV